VCEPLGNGFRFGEGLAIFKDRMRCLPEASGGLKQIAQDNLAKVDAHLAERQFLCGTRFTMADVLLYAFLDFAGGVGQPINPMHRNVKAWFERVGARPSAEASLNPAAVNAGLRG
jgi:glutathione S-transferase